MDQQITQATGAPEPAITAELRLLAARAADYAAKSTGEGTRAAYNSAWRHYTAWCHQLGQDPLSGDPGLVALYLARRADDGLAVSSIRVARAAIAAAHRLASQPLNLTDPRLAMVMEGIARQTGLRPRRQATPATPDRLRRLLDAITLAEVPTPQAVALAVRNRAMLLIGFAAALRRSELVALDVADISAVDGKGLAITIRRSKTDQQGSGRTLAIRANPQDLAFCPAAAWAAWLEIRRTARDCTTATTQAPALPLFCSVSLDGMPTGRELCTKTVNRLIKQAAAKAGLDPEGFSGHSLRRGLLTAAAENQVPLAELMRHSRHKSVATALSYIEPADLWRNNVTERVYRGG